MGAVSAAAGRDAFTSADDGPPVALVEAAWRAYRNAYVPYSGFPVGAALRDEDGTVHVGSNVENASYGLGRCAEQSAIQAMATAGARTFREAVIVSGAEEPASPCGACRQILFEFAPDAVIWMLNDKGETRRHTVRALLPHGFTLSPGADRNR